MKNAEKIKALEKQLKETQKALQDEKLKSRAYEIMIDVVEQEFIFGKSAPVYLTTTDTHFAITLCSVTIKA